MLDERKWSILEAIIREYILNAEPVGSRSLTRRYDFGVSAATIRNEMADLEELGYLEQPHTSAGRIPSDLGYRIFVDALLKSNDKLKDVSTIARDLKDSFINKQQEIHDLLKATTRMLARFTHYTSMGISPNIRESVFQHLQLIPVSTHQVVAVLVTDHGLVHHQTLAIPVSMDRKELGQISEFINDRLQGQTLSMIDDEMMLELEKELMARYDTLSDIFKMLYTDLLRDVNKKLQQLFLDGTSNMMDQPEFADLDKLKQVMNVLEQRELLYNILNQNGQDIHITIGQENAVEEMKNCSIVSATYGRNGRPMGRIGIIGPTRMEYGKVITMVQYTANLLSKILSEEK